MAADLSNLLIALVLFVFVFVALGFIFIIWHMKENHHNQITKLQKVQQNAQIATVELKGKLKMQELNAKHQVKNIATAHANTKKQLIQQISTVHEKADINLARAVEQQQVHTLLLKQEIDSGLNRIDDKFTAANQRQMDYNGHVSDRIMSVEKEVRRESKRLQSGLDSMDNRFTKAIDDQNRFNLKSVKTVQQMAREFEKQIADSNHQLSERISSSEFAIKLVGTQMRAGIELVTERIDGEVRGQKIFNQSIQNAMRDGFNYTNQRITDQAAYQAQINNIMMDEIDSVRSSNNGLLGNILGAVFQPLSLLQNGGGGGSRSRTSRTIKKD